MKNTSLISRVLEKILWLTKIPSFKGVNNFDEHYEKLKNKHEHQYDLPKLKFKSEILSFNATELPVYHIKSKKKSQRCIVYLHGGGFLHEIKLIHWIMLDKLCQDTGIDIYVPLYHLVPNYSFIHSNDNLMKLYDVLNTLYSEDNISFMSDSAGGSLALSITLQQVIEGNKGPRQNILISPWVNVAMEDDHVYESYEAIDPLLGLYALRKAGKAWADDLDVKDYRISPIYGDLSLLRNIMIITGTKDMLYPDIVEFNNRLKAVEVRVQYLEYKDMLHAFILFALPESIDAYNKIKKFLLEDF